MEVFLYTARIKCSLLLQTRDGESCIFPRMVSKLSQFNTVVYRLVPNEQNFTCTCTVGTQCLGSNRWRNWVILGLCKYLAMVQLAAPYWRHTERQEIASSVCVTALLWAGVLEEVTLCQEVRDRQTDVHPTAGYCLAVVECLEKCHRSTHQHLPPITSLSIL